MPYIPQEQRPEIDAIVDLLMGDNFSHNDMVANTLGDIILRLAQGICLGTRVGRSAQHPTDSLVELLDAVGDPDEIAGRLNYALSRIMWRFCGHDGRGVRRYARMNAVYSAIDFAHDDFRCWVREARVTQGVLAGRDHAVNGAIGLAKAEFRRRLIDPYEDEKIESAGDVAL